MKKNKIRVLITDQETVFRVGLKNYLEENDTIEVVAEASDGLMMLEKYNEYRPDVVMSNLRLPLMDGLVALKEVKNQDADAKIVVFSSDIENECIPQIFAMRIMGYILKSAEISEFANAVWSSYENHPFFCKAVSFRLKDLVLEMSNPKKNKPSVQFSKRELEIIKLICQEKTSREIAKVLYLSKRTIDGYRTQIMEKIGVKGLVGIINYAISNGIISEHSNNS